MGDPSQVQLGFEVVNNASLATPVRHIVAGSFRALSLVLLAFSPLNRTLELVQQVSSLGPHQYLTTNANRNVVYATSWADPPSLSSWAVQSHPSWSLSLINSVPISEYQRRVAAVAFSPVLISILSRNVVLHFASTAIHSSLFRGWSSRRSTQRGSSDRRIRKEGTTNFVRASWRASRHR